MTPDERGVAELLERLAPEPPRDVDLDRVGALAGSRSHGALPVRDRRLRSWVPAVAIAAVVVVVISVVSVALSISGDHHPRTPSSSTPPVQTTRTTPPPPTTIRHGLGRVIGPWNATVRRYLYDGPVTLATGGSDLILNDAHTLLRLDPRSGRVLARASAPGEFPWTVSDGLLFVQPGPAGGFVGPGGSVELQRRSAVTLEPLPPYEVSFPGVSSDAPVAYAGGASGSPLYLGAGHQIAVVNPRTGGVERRYTLPTPISSLALSPAGDQLYAATAPPAQEATSHLYAVDPQSGAIRWEVSPPAPIGVLGALPGGAVVATYGGMHAGAWVASGADGSRVDTADVASFGGGATATVASTSEQTVVGSFGLVCLDPHTGRLRARAPSPRDISPLIVVAGRWYGVVQSNTGGDAVLISFQPPAAC